MPTWRVATVRGVVLGTPKRFGSEVDVAAIQAPLERLEFGRGRAGMGAEDTIQGPAFVEELLVGQAVGAKTKDIAANVLPTIDVDFVGAFQNGPVPLNRKGTLHGAAVTASEQGETFTIGLACIGKNNPIAGDCNLQGTCDGFDRSRFIIEGLGTQSAVAVVASDVVDINVAGSYSPNRATKDTEDHGVTKHSLHRIELPKIFPVSLHKDPQV